MVLAQIIPRIPGELQLDLAISQWAGRPQRGESRQSSFGAGPGDHKTEGKIMNDEAREEKITIISICHECSLLCHLALFIAGAAFGISALILAAAIWE